MKKKILLALIVASTILSNESKFFRLNSMAESLINKPCEIVDNRENETSVYQNNCAQRPTSEMVRNNVQTYQLNENVTIYGNTATGVFYEEDGFNYCIERAETISPYFDSPQSYVLLDQFETYTYGTIGYHNDKNYDVDYYKFYLYGFSTVYLQLGRAGFTCNYDFALYSYNADKITNLDYGVTTIFSSTSGYRRMSINLEAGLYFIKIYPKTISKIDTSAEYELYMDCRYKKGENVNVSDLRYNKGAKGALWCSDMYLFNNSPFSKIGKYNCGDYDMDHYSKENILGMPLPDQGKVQKLFYNFDKFGKVLNSSLFVWGKDARDDLYKIIDNLLTEYNDELERAKKAMIQYTTWSEVASIVGAGWDALQLGLGIVAFFIDPTGIAKFLIITDMIWSGINLASGGDTVDLVLRTIFPEAETVNDLHAYVGMLKQLRTELKTNPTTSEAEIVRIDSYYEFDPVEDYCYEDISVNYSFDSSSIAYDYYIEESQSGSYFHGRTYPLFDFEESMQNARDRKFYIEYPDVNTGGENMYLPNVYKDLNIGEYHWYYFVAPETANYEFKSIIVNAGSENLDTFGELFTSIVPGRSIEGRLDYDDNHGDGDNFSIIAKLEKGHKIFVRVRGTNWDTFGRYALSISKSSDASLYFDTLNAQRLDFSRTYNTEPENTTVCLTDETPLYTERVRCACISWENKKYLTLSAKSRAINTAYLSFNFVLPIENLSFDIGLWSKDEYLTGNTNSKIRLFVDYDQNGCNWVEFHNFDILSMSKDKDSLDSYNFKFDFPVYKVKFLVETNLTNIGANKGRVVLDSIAISYR